MGRHSLGDEATFWRSLTLFVIKWVGIAVLPVLMALGLFRLFAGDEQEPVVDRTPPPAAAPSPSPSPEPSPEPSPPPSPEPSPSPSPAAENRGKVQVLNGSDTSGLGRTAAEELEDEGFEVVAVNPAANKYDKTTIFYRPGFENMAREVARVLGSNIVEPAPDSLKEDIPVTAVIGRDYKP